MIPLPVCHRDTRSTCRTRFVSLATNIKEPLRLVVFGALRGLIRRIMLTTIVGVGRGVPDPQLLDLYEDDWWLLVKSLL